MIELQPAYSIRDRSNMPHIKSGCMAAIFTCSKSIKHPAASGEVLSTLFKLLVFNQLAPQGARN
jgi:hypothetical protein